MLRKLNGSKEALSKDNKSMNAFKKNGFRYVVLRNRIFYPFMKFLIYLTELRLRMYETSMFSILPTYFVELV